MSIDLVRGVTAELVEAFRRLLPQLSAGCCDLTAADLDEIVRAPSNRVLVARDSNGRIVGTATVVLIRIPSARRARLESVVVESAARGKGVGEALCRYAIRIAREAGASALDLTSAPGRGSANRLYERLQFERRGTNVYRLELSSQPTVAGSDRR